MQDFSLGLCGSMKYLTRLPTEKYQAGLNFLPLPLFLPLSLSAGKSGFYGLSLFSLRVGLCVR